MKRLLLSLGQPILLEDSNVAVRMRDKYTFFDPHFDARTRASVG